MMATSNGSAQPAQIDHAIDLSAMDAVFEQYRGQKGALIPILQEAQNIYGYLPPQVQQRIAERLGLSLSKVYGVATFYAQFYLERARPARAQAVRRHSLPRQRRAAGAGCRRGGL